jgi:hypothetical protein
MRVNGQALTGLNAICLCGLREHVCAALLVVADGEHPNDFVPVITQLLVNLGSEE